jgi:hypothetical protein
MRKMLFGLCLFLAANAGFGLAGQASAATTQFGPSPYFQTSDSPFAAIDFSGGYFHLEDFEDHALNTPGVSGTPGGPTSVVFGPSIHDSVDADDGVIDGSGLNGDSWFCATCPVTFTFNALTLGSLPTHAGIVWTDGVDTISFEAFDQLGNSLGVNGPNTHANASNNGETAEDRFYGVFNSSGISAIKLIPNGGGGIELDHVQYGRAPAPVPMVSEWGLIAMTALLLSTGTLTCIRSQQAVSLALAGKRSRPIQ